MTPLRVTAVLPLLLAAGCAAPLDAARLAGGEDAPVAAPALAFAAPVAMPMTGSRAGEGIEPSVAVDADGNVYLTAAKGVRLGALEGSWLWVSRDRGATFQTVPAVAPPRVSAVPVGAEGHVDVAPDGTAYFVDLTHLASMAVSASTDGGATWDLRAPATTLVGGGDRPWVAAGPEGRVYLAWNQVPSGFWVLASSDGGRTFPVQTPFPGTSIAQAWAYVAVPVVAPDGTLYVARGEADGPAVYVSKDGARTFERRLAWEAEGEVGWLFTTPAVDAAGALYVSTVEATPEGPTRVKYAYSTDGGATFSAPREVTHAAGAHAMQWSAAGPAGAFAIAFYEDPNGTGVPEDAKGPWFLRVVASTDAARPDAVFAEARVTPEPVKEGAICTGGLTACENGRGRELGDYLGVDVGADGAVHVTWAAERDGATGIWYAQVAASPQP